MDSVVEYPDVCRDYFCNLLAIIGIKGFALAGIMEYWNDAKIGELG
jgi:hypothetical protein